MSGRSFVSKNLAVIVMIPFIIGCHYGWYKLQKVDSLVPAEDRKKLPFASRCQPYYVMEYCLSILDIDKKNFALQIIQYRNDQSIYDIKKEEESPILGAYRII